MINVFRLYYTGSDVSAELLMGTRGEGNSPHVHYNRIKYRYLFI